jgi:hypothetical protein
MTCKQMNLVMLIGYGKITHHKRNGHSDSTEYRHIAKHLRHHPIPNQHNLCLRVLGVSPVPGNTRTRWFQPQEK